MNVLYVAHMVPWPANSGAVQRALHIARGLARRHAVRVLAFSDGPLDPAVEHAFLEASGCESLQVVLNTDCAYRHEPVHQGWPAPHEFVLGLVRSPLPLAVRAWRSRAFASALAEYRASGWVDAVWAVRIWMAEMARQAGFKRIAVDVDDLMSVMAQQHLDRMASGRRMPLLRLENLRLRRYERRLALRLERTVLAKEEDIAFFEERARGRIAVVPNGVTIPPAVGPPPRLATPSILFVGTLPYAPNVDAIEFFARDVLPRIWAVRAEVRFVVAGRGPATHLEHLLADPRCTIVESAPDLGPCYAAADLVVAPVRTGGGTRIKILEGLAHGRPLVSTRFAAEGIDVREGIDIAFADDPAAMAAQCLALLDDADASARMGASGRARVAERYNWATIEAQVSTLFN